MLDNGSRKRFSIFLFCLIASALVLFSSHLEAKQWKNEKILQIGTLIPPPETRARCVNWAKGDYPWGGGWKVCVGHAYETRTRQYAVYFVVNGPESVEQAVRDATTAAIAACSAVGITAAEAALGLTPADPASRVAAAAAAATTSFSACMTGSAGLSAAVASAFQATVVGREFWGNWG